jgi:hypothetical protein
VGGGERIFSFPIIIFFSPGYLLVEWNFLNLPPVNLGLKYHIFSRLVSESESESESELLQLLSSLLKSSVTLVIIFLFKSSQ